MKRRTFFGSAALTGLALQAGAATPGKRYTFVLIHGAWHGGWCWVRVAERLRAAGHVVHAPTLSGLGERRHLISPQIRLDTHIDDVILNIEFEELQDVVLVAHSYGGIIASGVADRIPQRLRHLVFLDSLMLESGKSLFSSFPKEVVEQRLKVIQETGGGVGAVAAFPPTAFGVRDPDDVAWVARRLTPQPVGTYLQPLILQGPIGNNLPRTYIECTVDPLPTLAPSRELVSRDKGFQRRSLATGHDAMVIAPAALTEMLLDIAA